jgi:hypothetical protein
VRPSSPNATRSCGNGLPPRLERSAEDDREVGGGFGEPDSAHDVDEDVVRGQGDIRVPVQHGEEQREPVRLESDRDAAGIRERARVDEALHFDEHLARAFARDRHDGARHGLLATRQEDRGRVAHLAQAPLLHREHADLIGGAEAVS